MSNPNPNPTDDFDFSVEPSAPSQKKKAGSGRATRAAAVVLFVLAGTLCGYALPALLAFTPDQTVPRTTWTHASQTSSVYSFLPDMVWNPSKLLADESTHSIRGYVTFPLDERPAGFTSAVAHLPYSSHNFTWVNVSLVTEPWNYTTLTWNNRPAQGEWITCQPVYISDMNDLNITFDVTPLVARGLNLSMCLSIMYNNTYVVFVGNYDWLVIAWNYSTPIAPDLRPSILIAIAAGVAVVAFLLSARSRGGGKA